jgi:hypothetical protein
MRDRPVALLAAAGAQAAEAALVFIASVLAALDTATGKSYQLASGIALTVIGFGTALALAAVAAGVARARLWSRSPALMSQLFSLIVGIYLLRGSRYDWGTAAVLIAVAGFVALLLPRSQRLLRREPRPPPAGGNAPAGGKPPADRKGTPGGRKGTPGGRKSTPGGKPAARG